MVWHNPGRPEQSHLQILGCCVHSLRTTDPKTGEVKRIDDLDETRRICYELQKKAVKPEHVYAHVWEEGELVIFVSPQYSVIVFLFSEVLPLLLVYF